MSIPYLLLDIDGVFIPFPAPDGTTPPTHIRQDVLPSGRKPEELVTIWLNPDHGPLLMHVARSGLVAPVRCTSWRQDAASVIGPLLGLFRVADRARAARRLRLLRCRRSTMYHIASLLRLGFEAAWPRSLVQPATRNRP